ncbi:MAG: GCN5-related N-acetyltransferase [Parcubacteria group bacterium]|nr:GCN5-related N-acetyltransferase [Parcubacteria group bacterium]
MFFHDVLYSFLEKHMQETQGPIFLRGRTVNLRPVRKEDLPYFLVWINDPDLRDFILPYMPMTMPEEEEWFADLGKRKPSDVVLSIETTDGCLIGNMGMHRIDWRSRVGTTGAIIGEKDAQGKGYGTEAKTLLLHHAFTSMNLRKICSQVIAFNKRSEAYSKKCGYKEDGVQKQHVFRRGEYHDLINLAVFWDDFKPIWEKYQMSEETHAPA